jgi:ethanolamine utilization protein EutM
MALGIIEAKGFVAAVAAADAMLKAADVEVYTKGRIESVGVVAVFIRGDIAAVKAAVDVGAEAAKAHGQVASLHVIPLPKASAAKVLGVDIASNAPGDWGKL